MKKIYVAIPYTGYEEESFRIANQAAADIIEKGNIPFSPISMSHPITMQSIKDYGLKDELSPITGKWDIWEKIDYSFLDWCDEVHVITFNEEAVKNSIGVQGELKYAEKLGKPIKIIKKY